IASILSTRPLRSGSLAAPKESQRAAEEPLKDGRGTVSRSGRPVEFSLLGPFEVRRAGRPVALAGAKQRALVALLALHPNEVLSLTVGHPLRARLRGQLMLALYRSGRQAEALEVYRSMRRMLSDDLGLEPSPALRDLERRILRHDPSLDLGASAAPGRRAAG